MLKIKTTVFFVIAAEFLCEGRKLGSDEDELLPDQFHFAAWTEADCEAEFARAMAFRVAAAVIEKSTYKVEIDGYMNVVSINEAAPSEIFSNWNEIKRYQRETSPIVPKENSWKLKVAVDGFVEDQIKCVEKNWWPVGFAEETQNCIDLRNLVDALYDDYCSWASKQEQYFHIARQVISDKRIEKIAFMAIDKINDAVSEKRQVPADVVAVANMLLDYRMHSRLSPSATDDAYLHGKLSEAIDKAATARLWGG